MAEDFRLLIHSSFQKETRANVATFQRGGISVWATCVWRFVWRCATAGATGATGATGAFGATISKVKTISEHFCKVTGPASSTGSVSTIDLDNGKSTGATGATRVGATGATGATISKVKTINHLGKVTGPSSSTGSVSTIDLDNVKGTLGLLVLGGWCVWCNCFCATGATISKVKTISEHLGKVTGPTESTVQCQLSTWTIVKLGLLVQPA